MTQVATAVVFESPGNLSLREVGLPDCAATDCLVEIDWSGISTGTERLLWDGRMPHFPDSYGTLIFLSYLTGNLCFLFFVIQSERQFLKRKCNIGQSLPTCFL